MDIGKEQIEHIAKLARLGISEEEKEQYAKDLARILDYFKKLERADTEDVTPIAQITNLRNIVRQDKGIDFKDKEIIIRNSPEQKDNFIKVKSIL